MNAFDCSAVAGNGLFKNKIHPVYIGLNRHWYIPFYAFMQNIHISSEILFFSYLTLLSLSLVRPICVVDCWFRPTRSKSAFQNEKELFDYGVVLRLRVLLARKVYSHPTFFRSSMKILSNLKVFLQIIFELTRNTRSALARALDPEPW